jgi:hypothetical protein
MFHQTFCRHFFLSITSGSRASRGSCLSPKERADEAIVTLTVINLGVTRHEVSVTNFASWLTMSDDIADLFHLVIVLLRVHLLVWRPKGSRDVSGMSILQCGGLKFIRLIDLFPWGFQLSSSVEEMLVGIRKCRVFSCVHSLLCNTNNWLLHLNLECSGNGGKYFLDIFKLAEGWEEDGCDGRLDWFWWIPISWKYSDRSIRLPRRELWNTRACKSWFS